MARLKWKDRHGLLPNAATAPAEKTQCRTN
jgi:hypothetical protein